LSQGLPAKLRNVNFDSLDDNQFLDIFKTLSTEQRNKILPVLESQAPEAVERIRLFQYNKFLEGATRKLDDGTFGVDFEKLVSKYNTLKPDEKELLAFSLGTKADDFASRMEDATKFFRYNMKITGAAAEPGMLSPDTIVKTQAAVGAVAGYQAAKATDIGMRILSGLSMNLSDTDILKILLTKEGKDFLKQARLSPAGAKTLESLDKLRLSNVMLPQGAFNLKRGFDTLSQEGNAEQQAEELVMPEQQFEEIPVEYDEEDQEEQLGIGTYPTYRDPSEKEVPEPPLPTRGYTSKYEAIPLPPEE
jgi:hypothetical protein